MGAAAPPRGGLVAALLALAGALGMIGALATMIAAPAAGAATATFGSNLADAPNFPYSCNESLGAYWLYTGYSSCTYFDSSTAATLYAPASGTISAVRVRAGAVTGKMQVLVLRSLYRNTTEPGKPDFACCFVEQYGPIFTPAQNTVTTVPTSMPVTEEATPPPDDTTTIAAGDFIALSVLEPNVPIPMYDANQSFVAGFYPAPTEATFPAPSQNADFISTDYPAGEVLIDADLTTGGAPAPPGPPPTGPPSSPARTEPFRSALPRLTLPATIPLRGGTAAVPVQCLLGDCSGQIALQSQRLAGAAALTAKASHVVSYGTARFALKAGAKGTVKVKLDRAGIALFKHGRRTAKLWANVRFSSGAGKASGYRVTLRRR